MASDSHKTTVNQVLFGAYCLPLNAHDGHKTTVTNYSVQFVNS